MKREVADEDGIAKNTLRSLMLSQKYHLFSKMFAYRLLVCEKINPYLVVVGSLLLAAEHNS